MSPRDDRLLVCEPDFLTDPLGTVVHDVTTTLATMVRQGSLGSMLGVGVQPPGFVDAVEAEPGVLDADTVVVRHDVVDGVSTRVLFAFPEGEHDRPEPTPFTALFVAEIFARRRELLTPMILPAGWIALVSGFGRDTMIRMVIDDHDDIRRYSIEHADLGWEA